MMLSLPLLVTVTMSVGCTTVELNNSQRLIDRHPAGFRDAVRASTNSVVFVSDALKTINRLESALERR